MTAQEAIALVDSLLHPPTKSRKLNDIQSRVFLETWEGHLLSRDSKSYFTNMTISKKSVRICGENSLKSSAKKSQSKICKQSCAATSMAVRASGTLAKQDSSTRDWESDRCFPRFTTDNRNENLETSISSNSTRLIGIFELGMAKLLCLSNRSANSISV